MEYNPDEILFNLRYNYIYYVTAFITLFFVVEFYIKNKSHTKAQNFFLILIFLCLIILFGTRGYNVGTDTLNNIKYFTGRVQIKSFSELNDLGLYTISILLQRISNNITDFLIVLAILYIVPFYISFRNLKLKNPLIFFFCIFSMFFFKGMGINIQKQGLAFSFFILGVTFIFKNIKFFGYLLFGLAFLFHASIIIPISIFFVSFKIKKTNWIFIIYLLSTLLALVNFNLNNILSQIPIVNILTESRLDTYYTDKGNYKIGFRPEFWIFNTIFTIIGYITYRNIQKFNSNFLNDNYKTFYVAYVLLSSFFFLMFSARFSDRFGLMSWLLIPFLLMPYLQNNTKVKFLNTLTVYILCVILFIAFKYI